MNKKRIAKVLGASIVGCGTLFVVTKIAGRAATEGLGGAVVLMLAHEAFNAPVSNWVYQQL